MEYRDIKNMEIDLAVIAILNKIQKKIIKNHKNREEKLLKRLVSKDNISLN